MLAADGIAFCGAAVREGGGGWWVAGVGRGEGAGGVFGELDRV